MEASPVKLLYAMAFALFPLTVTAQTPDQAPLTALCHDDYLDDPGDHCKSLASRENFTIEAILAAYGEIISSDADDESVFYLADPGDTPVSAIGLRQSNNATARDDDARSADHTKKENTVAAQTITSEPSHEKDEHVIANTDDATNPPSPVGIAAGRSIFSDEDRAVE
jgi:hypothetical protein